MNRNNIDAVSSKVVEYLTKYLSALAMKGSYIVLLLLYAYQSGNVPAWAKRIIFGSLAYFISPIDAIPDLTPFIGMTDDIGLLSFSLVTIACYIDSDVRQKAQNKLQRVFKNKVDWELVDEVDAML